jgi:hypothetical protein
MRCISDEVVMEASTLFLRRCEQVESLSGSHKEIDLLDLAGIVRQLLLDGTPLVHKVNRYGIKLRFLVGDFVLQLDEFTTSLDLADGLDPDTARPGKPAKELSLDGFLGHKVILMQRGSHSVRDVIQFAANIAGGVHHSQSPKDAQKLLADYGAMFSMGGVPAGIRLLQAIGRVTMKGLAPLIEAVRKGPPG